MNTRAFKDQSAIQRRPEHTGTKGKSLPAVPVLNRVEDTRDLKMSDVTTGYNQKNPETAQFKSLRGLASKSAAVVQRTTVKVGSSEKDLIDFRTAQPTLIQYIGETPIGIAESALAGEAGKTLNIWAHMDSSNVGGMSHAALAALLISKGYRTSAAIRLIGCNVRSIPTVGPQLLWEALNTQLSALATGSERPTVPTIYATKGTLHTGNAGLSPERHFFVVHHTHPEVREVEEKIMQERMTHMEMKLKKYRDEDRNEAKATILSQYASEVSALQTPGGISEEQAKSKVIEDHITEIEEIVKSRDERNGAHYERTYDYRWGTKMKQAKVERVEDIQARTGYYPSIFKRNTENTAWEWNDAAWVSYP